LLEEILSNGLMINFDLMIIFTFFDLTTLESLIYQCEIWFVDVS